MKSCLSSKKGRGRAVGRWPSPVAATRASSIYNHGHTTLRLSCKHWTQLRRKVVSTKNDITMSNSDCLPDYPVTSDLVKRLKSALDASNEEGVRRLICTEVGHVDAVIELANDDWMKDPSAQLPPGVLVGNWNESAVLEPRLAILVHVRGEPLLKWRAEGWKRQVLAI